MTESHTPARAAIYVRTTLQFFEQVAPIVEAVMYAQTHGMVVARVYKDHVVGGMQDRPGLDALRAAIQNQSFDVVIAAWPTDTDAEGEERARVEQELVAAGVVLHPLYRRTMATKEWLTSALGHALPENWSVHYEVMGHVQSLLEALGRADRQEMYEEAIALADRLALHGDHAAVAPPPLTFLRLKNDHRLEQLRTKRRVGLWPVTTDLRAAIYARPASWRTGAPNDLLVDAKRIARMAAREHGYQVVATVEDWETEETLDRPGLNALRTLVHAQLIDVVLIASWSILSCNTQEVLALHHEFLANRCAVDAVLMDRFEEGEDLQEILEALDHGDGEEVAIEA